MDSDYLFGILKLFLQQMFNALRILLTNFIPVTHVQPFDFA
jgi:hypothetical protein